ncbi:substrate-binding domain-containing protein [Salinispira pacifica]
MSTGPLFLRVASQIKGQIVAGTLRVGDYLPSVRRLQQSYGVSKNTVLSALRKLQEEEIIARQGASRNGFRVTAEPEGYIQEMSSSATETVAFVMPFSYWNYAGSKLLEAIENAFSNESIALVFGNHKNDITRERELLEMVESRLGRTAETLILMSASSHSPANVDILSRLVGKIPVFLLDRSINGVNTHLVSMNNLKVGRQAADLLLSRGRSKLSFVTGFWDASSVRGRFVGYREMLDERGYPLDNSLLVRLENTYGETESLDEAWDRLLVELDRLPDLPDGFFCASDKAAGAVLRFCEARGVKVPQEVSIVGCDHDHYVQSRCGRLITGFAYPFEAIASEFVRLYREFRVDRQGSVRTIEIDPEFVPGETL